MSRAGGMYRYYTCSNKARQGKTGCEGRSIPIDRLDISLRTTWKNACLSPSGWRSS
jgi:site-specific DNA recombinase